MSATFVRSLAVAFTLAAGAVFAQPATAMPINANLASTASSTAVPVGLFCTWVCEEHKMTAYGLVCVKRAQNCAMQPEGDGLRRLPPPARTTPR